MIGDLLAHYAMSFVGVPYLWGGNNAIEGFDCSGLAVEVLKAFGFKLQDMTAESLYLWCKTMNFRPEARAGSLAFYGRDGKVLHVGLMINKDLIVEAGGGGPTTTSQDAAASLDACVRVRPLRHRPDLIGHYYPNYIVSRVVT